MTNATSNKHQKQQASEQFFPIFLLPQESDLPTPGGIHNGFAWRCFPLLGLEYKFFSVDGGFPQSPGSTGSGHFLYTIISRLGSCCNFSPLVSLLDNHMGVRSGLGIRCFQKNVRFFAFFSVLLKRTFRSFCSFLFF